MSEQAASTDLKINVIGKSAGKTSFVKK